MSAPGWYPDPSGSGRQRWFDGVNWTPVAQPPPTLVMSPVSSGPPPAERRFTIHYGFALLAGISLLGTVIPAIFWFALSASSVHTDPGATQADVDTAHGTTGLMAFFGIGWLLWGGMWTVIWTAFAVHHTLRSRRD